MDWDFWVRTSKFSFRIWVSCKSGGTPGYFLYNLLVIQSFIFNLIILTSLFCNSLFNNFKLKFLRFCMSFNLICFCIPFIELNLSTIILQPFYWQMSSVKSYFGALCFMLEQSCAMFSITSNPQDKILQLKRTIINFVSG